MNRTNSKSRNRITPLSTQSTRRAENNLDSRTAHEKEKEAEDSSLGEVIVGTCTTHEKEYFRLPTKPDPSTVRTEKILREWLPELLSIWRNGQNYQYVCDQLKSIRQDLTVQHIQNEFTIEVYETNARIALENGDSLEFAVCLSQLESLAQEGHSFESLLEFVAYRLILSAITMDLLEINKLLNSLSKQQKFDKRITQALDIISSILNDNYRRYFILFGLSTHLSQCILKPYNERMRNCAIKAICKAYRPSIPISFIQTELRFDSESECFEYLSKCKAVLSEDKKTIQCQDTYKVVASM